MSIYFERVVPRTQSNGLTRIVPEIKWVLSLGSQWTENVDRMLLQTTEEYLTRQGASYSNCRKRQQRCHVGVQRLSKEWGCLSKLNCKLNCHKLRFSYVTSILITLSAAIFPFVSLVLSLLCVYTLLISHGAILNIKFMTSFAESNLSSCADFISLDHSKSNAIVKRRVQERSVSFLAPCKYYLR